MLIDEMKGMPKNEKDYTKGLYFYILEKRYMRLLKMLIKLLKVNN